MSVATSRLHQVKPVGITSIVAIFSAKCLSKHSQLPTTVTIAQSIAAPKYFASRFVSSVMEGLAVVSVKRDVERVSSTWIHQPMPLGRRLSKIASEGQRLPAVPYRYEAWRGTNLARKVCQSCRVEVYTMRLIDETIGFRNGRIARFSRTT